MPLPASVRSTDIAFAAGQQWQLTDVPFVYKRFTGHLSDAAVGLS
jgi:hypothetical protein